ncbi:MAG: bifunctional diaminohydroxyphosphoribosylaminopyrimidine deaminase/5-amino-6-(5-phosphoribosylamino)uracil reductase RibD [Gammaproteobacteria bacterium]
MTSMKHYMQLALAQAYQGRGWCAPNPAVGAIVVKDDQVLAYGYHRSHGQAHAEVMALKQLTPQQAAGADLYVTLEPCCHWGKTPPCTELIKEYAVRRVLYGYQDPNPQVAGNGVRVLQQAGIQCELLKLTEIDEFYRSYQYWQATGLPVVTVKLAITLDGKYTNQHKQPLAITGEQLAQFTHQQRLYSDGLLTSVNTINNDDPQFTARIDTQVYQKPVWVLDRLLQINSHRKIFNAAKSLTLLHSPQAPTEHVAQLQQQSMQCCVIPEHNHHLDLTAVIQHLGHEGLHDVWVEVGAELFVALVHAKLAQRVYLYVSPDVVGSGALSLFSLSDDVSGFLHRNAYQHLGWTVMGGDVMGCWEQTNFI